MDNEKFSGMTDEEIAVLAATDRSAADFLLIKYKNLVISRAKMYFLAGGDGDDLVQEGMIGLLKAIDDFSPDMNTRFVTFAELCIRRRIYSAIKQAGRQKHQPLNSYVSLNNPSDDDAYILSDALLGRTGLNPETLYLENENLRNIEHEINEKLSELEKRVLILHLQGMSYSEIGSIINKSAKSIDNALQRIKKKFDGSK